MKIDQINIHKVHLPFSLDFSHSRKKGPSVNNILVEIIADQGKTKGYGEGAPRLYVTGESQESVTHDISDFSRRDSFPWELNDVTQIWAFLDSLPNGKEHNAAICALEISLLDALAKSQHSHIMEFFPKDFSTDMVYYGAAIPVSNKERIVEVCRFIGKMGITKLRLKMGQDFEQNHQAIKSVEQVFGEDLELRVDINGAWDRELALKHIPLMEADKVKVVEQPMMPDDPGIAEFAEAMKNSGTVLMADESACSLEDIKTILKDGHYRMVNVKLSKCGGFRNALLIADHLRQNGISFQIGCQLGESGVLSAAGRVLCLLCGDATYYDGSYDAFLLKDNITAENVSFGSGGKAGPIEGVGLGVDVSVQSLKHLSNNCISLKRQEP